MNRTRARRATKILLASMLAAVVLVPGLAAASPTDEVDELVDDAEYIATEWTPRFLYEDVPLLIDDLLEWEPDLQEFLSSFDWVFETEPEAVVEFAADIVDRTPTIVENLSLPTKLHVTARQEPYEDSDEGSMLVIEHRFYSRPGGHSWGWGRTYTGTSSCDGVSGRRMCQAHEDLSPSEVTVARQTKRTDKETSVAIKAGVALPGEDKQEYAVSSPAVSCNGPAGALACDAVSEVLD